MRNSSCSHLNRNVRTGEIGGPLCTQGDEGKRDGQDICWGEGLGRGQSW